MHASNAINNTAHRTRALVAAFGVLGLTTLLAGTLVRGRATVRMGERVSPDEWPISFQLPLGWSEDRADQNAIELIDARESHNPKQILLIRVPKPPTLPLGEIAVRAMAVHLASILGGVPKLDPQDKPLGELPGVRVVVPETGDYIHVGEIPFGGTEIIMLRYHAAGPFGRRDRNTYERVAASVELVNRRKGPPT